MKKTFPLGFWNYVSTGTYGPEAVQDWVDCGMNLCLSPSFDPQKHDPKQLLEILDESARQGVRLIIDDKRARWNGALENPAMYRETFRKAYEDFGHHPATYGFYVGDEPRTTEQHLLSEAACRIQHETAPELVAFLNMLSIRAGGDSGWHHGIAEDFDEFIDGFARRAKLRLFSYDYYWQMNPPEMLELGLNGYYYNLRKYKEAAQRANLPLWVTNLSVGHFQYRCPREDDFRWQLNTSVAAGANGIWWFFMYMRLLRINYRVALIDEHWQRTEAFEWLSRVQRSFQHTYGTLMSGLVYEKTWHTVQAYGGYELFREGNHPTIRRVETRFYTPALLSFFRDDENRPYLALVNNSQTRSDFFMLHYMPRVKEMYRIAWGGTEVDVRENDVCNRCEYTEEGIRNGAWLAPGQMEVYRIVYEE